jgi:hypothetical protein
MDDIANAIMTDFESRRGGLSWFVRSLLLIGERVQAPRERLRILEMLQSMIADTGQNGELIDAIEGAKRSSAEFVTLIEQREQQLPAFAKHLLQGLDEPGLTNEQVKAARSDALATVLGDGADLEAGKAVREALDRLADPRISEAERTQLEDSVRRIIRSKRGD